MSKTSSMSCWHHPPNYLIQLPLSVRKSCLYLLPSYWLFSSLLNQSQQCIITQYTNIPHQDSPAASWQCCWVLQRVLMFTCEFMYTESLTGSCTSSSLSWWAEDFHHLLWSVRGCLLMPETKMSCVIMGRSVVGQLSHQPSFLVERGLCSCQLSLHSARWDRSHVISKSHRLVHLSFSYLGLCFHLCSCSFS